MLLFKAFFLFNRKEFQGEHLSWLSFSVKMEVSKTIGLNIIFPNIRFFNACLNFASIDQLIVPTLDTKVTKYLCLGWIFFFRQVSTF